MIQVNILVKSMIEKNQHHILFTFYIYFTFFIYVFQSYNLSHLFFPPLFFICISLPTIYLRVNGFFFFFESRFIIPYIYTVRDKRKKVIKIVNEVIGKKKE